MLVKVQIIADDGTTIIYEDIGNALTAFGWEPTPGYAPMTKTGQKLPGFCYIPEPPPRDGLDIAQFRHLAARYFG